MGRRSWVSLNADRLPSAGLLHYSLKKALIKAQATIRFAASDTHSEIEFQLQGHVPFKGRFQYWTRTRMKAAPANEAVKSPSMSVPRGESVTAFILNQAGASPAEVVEEHEAVNGAIRLRTAGLEATVSLPDAPNAFLIHSPLSLLIGLISEVASASSEEGATERARTNPPAPNSLRVYSAYFLTGTKLHAFEAVEMGRGKSEALIEARWHSLGTMSEATVREHTWPEFDWSESAPLALTIDFERRILVRAAYRAPFLGSVTLEFTGAVPGSPTA